MKLVPQFIWILWSVNIIIVEFKKYRLGNSLHPKKEFKNFCIGILSMNVLLYYGGFYNDFWL